MRSDYSSAVYEGGREDNNVIQSDVIGLAHPNLIARNVTLGNSTPASGETLHVDWAVANTGAGAAAAGWADHIYLSRDEIVDTNDILLSTHATTAELPFAAGAEALMSADVELPIDVSGNWFLLVAADGANVIEETGHEDDNAGSAALSIDLSPYAELSVTDFTAPSRVVADPARVTFGWTVTNDGPGRGITDSWVDRIFVSTDDVIGDADDFEIGRFGHSGGLEAGESYSLEESIFLPTLFSGRFTLYVETDAEGVVFENGFETNNRTRLDGFFDVMPIPFADMVLSLIHI